VVELSSTNSSRAEIFPSLADCTSNFWYVFDHFHFRGYPLLVQQVLIELLPAIGIPRVLVADLDAPARIMVYTEKHHLRFLRLFVRGD
jgi:hypothetical protein